MEGINSNLGITRLALSAELGWGVGLGVGGGWGWGLSCCPERRLDPRRNGWNVMEFFFYSLCWPAMWGGGGREGGYFCEEPIKLELVWIMSTLSNQH